MATIMDVGLLNYFMPVFIFLLIFAFVFAVLTKTKIFGANAGANAVIALVIGLMFMIIPSARQMILIMTPWFVLVLLLVFILFLILIFIGLGESSLATIAKNPGVYIILLIIVAVIFFVAVGKTFPAEQPIKETYWAFIVHPKFWGVVITFLIAAFAVWFIGAVAKK